MKYASKLPAMLANTAAIMNTCTLRKEVSTPSDCAAGSDRCRALQRAAHPRLRQVEHHPEHEQGHAPHHQVVGPRPAEVERPDAQPGDAADAVGAVGQVFNCTSRM